MTAQIVVSRRIATALAGLVLAVLIATTAASPAQAIHRGYDAPMSTFRFMASLRLADTPDSHRCGGTLIKPDIVLTAAHCVAGVPMGGLVVVVGADVPDWSQAPRIATSGHAFPGTLDLQRDNRHDIAVVRLAVPQVTPGIRLGATEPRVGRGVVTAGWGCTNAPPICTVRPTKLQASAQTVLPDTSCGTNVFWLPPTYARTNICTKGRKLRSTVNSGDSGGPLLVPDGRGGFRQVGVTTLAADSPTKLYAGFTSIPAERRWIDAAIRSLQTG